MYKKISFSDFDKEFHEYGYEKAFSYDGRRALFGFLESLEENTGVEVELDVIALCSEFAEYSNIEEFQKDYGAEYSSIEDIAAETILIPVEGDGFIVQQF